jgi:hypothetical protein
MLKWAAALFYGQLAGGGRLARRIKRFMEKAITEGWKFFLPAGTAAAVGAALVYSAHPDVAASLWWNTLFGFGILLIVLAIYGVLALVFPSIAPRPQTLQDALFWTAGRYRKFAAKNSGEPQGDVLALRFNKKHPLAWRNELAMRVHAVSGGAAKINWALVNLPPNSADVILNVANHLEQLAVAVPPNVRV